MQKSRMMVGILIGVCVITGLAISTSAAEKTLTIAIESDPTNIDPRFGTDVNSARVYQLVCSGLIQKDPQSNLVPDLAEKWATPDDKTYIFYLRKGVKFHDGTEFTAEDVRYTFESTRDPNMKSPKAEAFKKIQSIEILDPYTIKFTLSETFAPFLIEMTLPIVPKKAAEAQPDQKFTDRLIGTGAFEFVEWKHDEQLVLSSNAEYFGGAPKLDGVIFKIIPDDTVRFLELQQGNVDLVQNAIQADMIPVAQQTKGLSVMMKDSVIINYLAFNVKDPILSNVKVRQAIAYAIDRKSMIDNLLKGQASLATGVLSPANWAYEANVKTYNYDIAKAKALLDEAGYPDPDGDGPQPRFKIVYKTSTSPANIRTGEVFQAQLKQVGIEITEIQAFEWAKFYEDIKTGNFQIHTLRWVGITEPDIFYSLFHSTMAPPNGRNRGFYSNPEIDKLSEQGRLEINIEKRKAIYSQIQKTLAEDVPYVFLWYPYNVVIMNERVHDFEIYPDGDFASLKKVWVDEK